MVTSCKTAVQYHNQDIGIGTVKVQINTEHHHKDSSCCPFVVYPLPSLFLSLSPGITNLFSIALIFTISKLLHKWNHTVRNLLGMDVLRTIHSLKVHPSCWVYQELAPLYC